MLILGWLLASTLSAQIQFTDVTDLAGVGGDVYRSPSSHSLGINWIDVDVDGWPDLFLVGGGPGYPSHLFRNLGDGTFERWDEWLPDLPDIDMSGSVFADYDRDGDPDLYIYTDNADWRLLSDENLPDGPVNILLQNQWMENGEATVPGQPLFLDVAAAAGVEDRASPPFGDLPAYRSKTAAWLDYDRDGCIDLFVGHLVINAGAHPANQDRLYRNRCDGTFEDVTVSSGLQPGTDPTTYRGALASGGFHMDDDLWPDLWVVNVSYSDPQPYIDELIYRNLGPSENGVVTFEEVSHTMPGVGDDAQAGMGIDVADIDNDGDWDIYISDLLSTVLDEEPRGNVLYLGDGANGFHDNLAPEAGVAGDSSWGVNFFDADRDGDEDLFVSIISIAEGEMLYRNDGVIDGLSRFTNVAEAAGIETGDTRASAIADYDRDGDLDLAVMHQHGPLQLWRNDTTSDGHWLAIELKGQASNRDAVGAVVEATTGAITRMRQVKGGSSAHSQDAFAVHFGLGAAERVDELIVRWPSGEETHLYDVAADRYLEVVENRIFADPFESGNLGLWSAHVGSGP